MNIKYFVNYDLVRVDAINMDNVKRIYVEHFKDTSKILGELYFDDIKVHILKRDLAETKINEIINSEEKILEIYNSDIIKTKLSEENRSRIFKNGFNDFKEFIKSTEINIESFIFNFKIIGVRSYIEWLKDSIGLNNDETNDYIVSYVLVFMYLRYIKEIS